MDICYAFNEEHTYAVCRHTNNYYAFGACMYVEKVNRRKTNNGYISCGLEIPTQATLFVDKRNDS